MLAPEEAGTGPAAFFPLVVALCPITRAAEARLRRFLTGPEAVHRASVGPGKGDTDPRLTITVTRRACAPGPEVMGPVREPALVTGHGLDDPHPTIPEANSRLPFAHLVETRDAKEGEDGE